MSDNAADRVDNPVPMHVRPYQPSDEPQVVALWHECGLVRPWNNPQRDIARKLTVQPEFFLTGWLSGALVATVMAGYEGHRGWVNYLAVRPDHRKQRFGLLMMQEVEQRLLAVGCPKINLQVRTSNQGVISFYESIGYQIDDAVSLGKRLIPDN